MDAKDLQERIDDLIETENPPGIGYYGAELDEEELAAARERMDEAQQEQNEGSRGTAAGKS